MPRGLATATLLSMADPAETIPDGAGGRCHAQRVRDTQAEHVTLRDGTPVLIRAVRPQDEPALAAFLAGLSSEARRLRFFSGAADVGRAAHWAAQRDPLRHGLVALDDSGTIVGHAVSVCLDPARAEVAVEVSDTLRQRGLGTVLIERLAALAESQGVRAFVAEVLPENEAMLDVFRLGFDARVAFHDGVELVEFPTRAWRVACERFADHSGGRSR